MSFVETETGVNINDLSEEEQAKYIAEHRPTLKCDHRSHEGKTFITQDPAQMQQHKEDGKHTQGGTTACAICNKPNISQAGLKEGKKPLCDECIEEVTNR